MATMEETSMKPKKSTEKMVNEAIKSLNDQTGSSVRAIKKYIISNYENINEKRTNTFIKKYLLKAVKNGSITQTKGIGAAGSFKISSKAKTKVPKPKEKEKKPLVKVNKLPISLDEKNTENNTGKKTEKKTSSTKSFAKQNKNEAPKLTVVEKPKKTQNGANTKKVSEKKMSDDNLKAADKENNNITVKAAKKGKNSASIKLVRKSINILNTATKRKITPTKNASQSLVANKGKSGSAMEEQVEPLANAKVKSAKKK